jgi:hypothetical protein
MALVVSMEKSSCFVLIPESSCRTLTAGIQERAMGMATQYVVQSYTARKGDRGRLTADAPFIAKDVSHARRTAERLIATKPMVIAFVNTGDADTGDYEEPKLIFAHGETLPEQVLEMERV